MLILLGGFLGSGRAFLARKLAQELEFHYCDINDYKMRAYFVGADRLVHEHIQEPLNDKARLFLYERVAKDLPCSQNVFWRGYGHFFPSLEAARIFLMRPENISTKSSSSGLIPM